MRNEIDLAGPEGLDAMRVDNIRPQKIDSPYTTRSTWLAQKALSGMKVVTPHLNWIPLSSTLGHGVSVLASGRLPYFGYATSHSLSWAFRATTGHFFEDKVIESLLCKSSCWIVQFLEKVVYVPAVVQFFDKVKNSFLSCSVTSSWCWLSLIC